MRRQGPLAERFWAKVRKTETCWLWTAGLNAQGYGRINARLDGRGIMLAHRVAWILAHGEVPNDLRCVLHRCDVRACVNPAHLFLGSRQDNTADMMAKGRHRSLPGEMASRAVLTDAKVIDGRRRYADGETAAAIARRFGVHPNTMRVAITGEKWRHLPGSVPTHRASGKRARYERRHGADVEQVARKG